MAKSVYKPKASDSIRMLRRRFQLAQQRCALDEVKLTKVHKGLLAQVDNLEAKHNARMLKANKSPNKIYIKLVFGLRRVIMRQYNRLLRECRGICETRSRVFDGCTVEQMEDRAQRLLRVPHDQFRRFDKLSTNEQERRLLELIEEHGEGSGNGGFADSLLLMPGYTSSHVTNELYEEDGKTRRPQFIHEIIDRLLYAVIHPQKFKALFFRKTKKKVQKWNDNWRQIRSEGRLSMVRVLIVLLPHLDFRKSLRIGYTEDRGQSFFGIRLKSIAKKAGLSLDQVNTAIKTLVDMDLFYQGKQPRDTETDENGEVRYIGLPVVRRMKTKLIEALGLSARYLKEIKVSDVNKLTPEQRSHVERFEEVKAMPDSFSAREKAFAEINISLI